MTLWRPKICKKKKGSSHCSLWQLNSLFLYSYLAHFDSEPRSFAPRHPADRGQANDEYPRRPSEMGDSDLALCRRARGRVFGRRQHDNKEEEHALGEQGNRRGCEPSERKEPGNQSRARQLSAMRSEGPAFWANHHMLGCRRLIAIGQWRAKGGGARRG